MLDRSQYDPKMITNLEIMTAYFVDIFYNHLYFEGKKLKTGGTASSVTEGYKHALNAFIKSLSNPKLYKKAVMGIHQYFLNYTSFTTISFAKCVDRVAANFVPVDYYGSLDNTQKMSILRLVINQAIKTFTKKVVNDHLSKIIDNHQDADNVRLLQDELVDIFLLEREAVYQRFISSQTHTAPDENINRLVSEKMQGEIKNLILEKIQLKKEAEALKRIIVKNNEELSRLREHAGTLESTVNELKAESARSRQSPPAALTPLFMPVNRGNLADMLNPASMPGKSLAWRPQSAEPNSGITITGVDQDDADDLDSQYMTHKFNALDDMDGDDLGWRVNSSPDQPTPPPPDSAEPPAEDPKPPPPEVPKAKTSSKKVRIQSDEPPRAARAAPKIPEMPKKKKPSAELGDGVTLDSFY